MLIDSKSVIKYRLYETGLITCTLAGAGNKKAAGGRTLGKKQKTFKVDKKVCRSTIIRQFNIRKNTIKFLTLTFPGDVNNKYANECFSKWIENLKKNYKVVSYVAIKELTKIGRPHYHVFIDSPYINYSKLNRAWCNTFNDTFAYSPNALTTRKGKSIIRNIKRAVNYASKYVTKPENYLNNPGYNITEDQYKDFIHNRLFFCDHFILSNGYIIAPGLMDYLKYTIKQAKLIVENDYFDIFVLDKFIGSLKIMCLYVENYVFLWYNLRYKDLLFLFSVENYCFLNYNVRDLLVIN